MIDRNSRCHKAEATVWVAWVMILSGCVPAEGEGETSVDTRWPVTNVVEGPANGSVTASSMARFSFETKVEGSTFECRHNGQGFSSCVSPHLLEELEDGVHYFAVRATGPAPNRAPTKPVERTWRIDSLGGEWQTITLDEIDDTGRANSLAIIGGRLAISYYDDTPDDLAYTHARVGVPTEPGDWLTHAVDEGRFTGEGTTLAPLANGHPAIAYAANRLLHFAPAMVPWPTDPNDWITHIVDPDANAAQALAFSVAAGRPVVIYQDWSRGVVKVALASQRVPQRTSDWRTYDLIAANAGGEKFSVALLGGNLVLALADRNRPGLVFAQAVREEPVSAEDWRIHQVTHSMDQETSMAVIDGRPALCFHRMEGDDLVFSIANVTEPETSTDWQVHVVDSIGSVGGYCTLVEWNGAPAIVYMDLTKRQLKLAVARVALPATNTDWRIEVLDVDLGAHDGATSMVVLESGELAISYYDGNADDLKFAIGVPAGATPELPQ